MRELGIYIHIPFCKSRCVYCDFFSGCDLSKISKYVEEVKKEIGLSSNKYKKTVDTVYFGGGTPSLLPPASVREILKCIKRNFDTSFREITLEVNPNEHYPLADYVLAGVNRISVGVESTNDKVLKKLGRRHDSKKAIDTLQEAKNLGVRVSADMLLATEGQTEDEIKDYIDNVAPLVGHISSYVLKVEEGTSLEKMVKNKKMQLPNDDRVADLYDFAVDYLDKLGFVRYETSNFSKINQESLHNLKYWKLNEYLGIGAGAHGFIDNKLYYNLPSVNDYLQSIHFGNGKHIIDDDNFNASAYAIMLGLRLKDGVDVKDIKSRFNIDLVEKYKEGLKLNSDYIEVTNDNIKIKPQYLFVQNIIISSILGADL